MDIYVKHFPNEALYTMYNILFFHWGRIFYTHFSNKINMYLHAKKTENRMWNNEKKN